MCGWGAEQYNRGISRRRRDFCATATARSKAGSRGCTYRTKFSYGAVVWWCLVLDVAVEWYWPRPADAGIVEENENPVMCPVPPHPRQSYACAFRCRATQPDSTRACCRNRLAAGVWTQLRTGQARGAPDVRHGHPRAYRRLASGQGQVVRAASAHPVIPATAPFFRCEACSLGIYSGVYDAAWGVCAP